MESFGPHPGYLRVWDMDAEQHYWHGASAQKGWLPEHFALRWPLMCGVYETATDPHADMQTALKRFLETTRMAAMDEDAARQLFGDTWARILRLTRR